ncbi:hypothetical protein LCGC14_2570930, partial [marine sediment metagenome]
RIAEARLGGYGIIAVSPLRAKEFLRTEGKIVTSYEYNPLSSEKGMITRDRYDVMNCDLVLANFLGAEKASCGTPVEFGWADAFGKPVVMVMEPEDNPFDHPMMRDIAGYRTETLEDAISVIRAILLPGDSL